MALRRCRLQRKCHRTENSDRPVKFLKMFFKIFLRNSFFHQGIFLILLGVFIYGTSHDIQRDLLHRPTRLASLVDETWSVAIRDLKRKPMYFIEFHLFACTAARCFLRAWFPAVPQWQELAYFIALLSSPSGEVFQISLARPVGSCDRNDRRLQFSCHSKRLPFNKLGANCRSGSIFWYYI